MIATAPKVDFDLTPAGTNELLKAGVSEETIKAMAAREGGTKPEQAPESSAATPGQSANDPKSNPTHLARSKEKPAKQKKKHIEPTLSRVYDAKPEQVYIAEVQAAGPALVNSVKEACLVNFRYSNRTDDGMAVHLFTATCRPSLDGKTTVTISLERRGIAPYGIEKWVTKMASEYEEKRLLEAFWAKLDANLLIQGADMIR